MANTVHPRSIVILDCGGQYAHLIARRVRECGAFSEIHSSEVSAAELRGCSGIILSGGPQSVYASGSPQPDRAIFALNVPILGICYGHQWIAHALGGKVVKGDTKEYGSTPIVLETVAGSLLAELPPSLIVWMSHGDTVTVLPPGFRTIAQSADCANAAVEDTHRRIFGVQFHVEVQHTEHGMDILRRFVELCDPAPWSIAGYSDRIAEEIRAHVQDRRVFLLVSGGVDSTVAFVLLNRVLGPRRVQGLLVDTGLMRKSESGKICEAFQKLAIRNLHVEDASGEFFAALRGVIDPEEKRRRIGDAFLEVQQRVSEEMGLAADHDWLLGQGTIYPDTIETGGTKHADQIKTHHNRVEAIARMIERGLVIEPLKDLYKDEVRQVGEELGLPHDLVWRHPFPGPGLAVRILCDDGRQSSVVHRQSPTHDLRGVGVPSVVLPVRSVGVQGDGRTYRHALALFAPEPCAFPEEFWNLATAIPNRDPAINRVLVCLSHREPFPFVVTPGTVTRDRADLLREADSVVDEEVRSAGLYDRIWQFPVVLLPVGTQRGEESIVLRPVKSQDAMTANASRLPVPLLQRIRARLGEIPGIGPVFIDLTSKPPATIEWE